MMWARWVVAIAGMLLVVVACNEPAKPPKAARAVSNTYDLSITLEVRDASGAEEYYTVDRDGAIGFGGGLDARFNRCSYNGQLDAADMQRLKDVIQQQRLLDGTLSSSNQPKNVRYEIKIRVGDQHLNKTIKGDNERIEPLRAVLRELANRRLGEVLDRQPKASVQQQPPAPSSAPATTQPR